MKTILTALLPITLLVAVIGFAVGSPGPARGADFAQEGHTQNRFCGSHCHHHGHYWSCGGRSYYCGGH